MDTKRKKKSDRRHDAIPLTGTWEVLKSKIRNLMQNIPELSKEMYVIQRITSLPISSMVDFSLRKSWNGEFIVQSFFVQKIYSPVGKLDVPMKKRTSSLIDQLILHQRMMNKWKLLANNVLLFIRVVIPTLCVCKESEKMAIP